MKNNNSVEKYFYQKNFSLLEIILIIISVISLIVATFVRGGGPVGLPVLLACVVTFFIYRSFKVKDNEIDHTFFHASDHTDQPPKWAQMARRDGTLSSARAMRSGWE